MTRPRAHAAAAAAVLTLTACGDQGPPPVGLIELLGSALSGEVAGTVTVQVRVDDESGQPIEGITVSFTPAPGAGSVAPREVSTGASGGATAQWTLGTTAGAQSLRVASGAKSITVQASARPGPPDALVAASGDDQTGQVGRALALPIVARVRDRFGNGVAGVAVGFATGSGTVADASVTSSTDGAAATTWTLAGTLGGQSASASVDGVGSVGFTATGVPGPPAAMSVVSGDGQSGVVGEALASPVVLEVRDEFGNPAIGAVLGVEGDGSVEPATPAVDDQARASFAWTLGTSAGPQGLAVSAGTAAVELTADAAAGPPARVEPVSGGGQESHATARLTEPLVALVIDAFGNPVPGATLSFVVTAGGGSALPASTTTDTQGRAETTWTLGVVVGTHALEARTAGAEPALFEAVAVSGPPASLAVTSGNGQTGVVGETLASPVEVLVADAAGTPVPGVEVTFQADPGSGAATTPSVVTPRTGAASTAWTLGTAAGAHTLRASVQGLSPAVATATAEPGPPTALLKHAGDTQTPLPSAAVAVRPAVRVTDRFGNGVAGVDVLFEVESGGGAVTGASQVTGADGVATVGSWTVGPAEGLNTLVASAAGLPSVTFAATASLSAYNIEVRFVGTPPSASQQAAFTNAAARWQQLVIGELSNITLDIPANDCGTTHPALSESIDDLLIFAQVVPIDGLGGVLGSAGPCYIRLSNGLTILGTMRFDSDDIDNLEGLGNLEDVVLHEMGHVLGLGSLSAWYDILVGRDGPDPYFPGARALVEYAAAGGGATHAVPVANTGGPGTRDSHWREAHMGRELMTGFLNAGVANFLSAITVGALQDLGYSVNTAAADAYTVFPGALRAAPDVLIPLEETLLFPRGAVDDRGRVLRIRR